MYVTLNFRSKAALLRAVAAGTELRVYDLKAKPTDKPKTDGEVFVEGPHAPDTHTWWAVVMLKDGIVTAVVR